MEGACMSAAPSLWALIFSHPSLALGQDSCPWLGLGALYRSALISTGRPTASSHPGVLAAPFPAPFLPFSWPFPLPILSD